MTVRFIQRIPYSTQEVLQTLSYFLLEDTDSALVRYGVRVLRCDAQGCRVEQASCPHMTSHLAEAESILSLLIRGSVPPCTLREILEDLLQSETLTHTLLN